MSENLNLSHTKNNSRSRAPYIDQIRVLLTVLVILHHTSIMFGAPGGWYLRSASTSLVELVMFTFFVSINQAFFMGFFFLLAGYFTPASYDGKGPLLFLRDRLIRLGIPIVVYGYILGPMTVALANASHEKPFIESWLAFMAKGHFNIGPLWFALALLLFSFAYFLWRAIKGKLKHHYAFEPTRLQILIGVFITGVFAFFLRQRFPLGQEVWFMQIGYFSSYIVLFAFGCAAAPNQWLEKFDGNTANFWSKIALFCIPSLFIYGIAAGAFNGEEFDTSTGWTLPALAYALWEPFVACGIILGLLWHFRNNPIRYSFFSNWSKSAYAAYIIHAPIVVALGAEFSNMKAASTLCFFIVGSGSVILSFSLAALIIKIPGANRVL